MAKIKIIQCKHYEELEKLFNVFEDTIGVECVATQTHINQDTDGRLVYTAIIYWRHLRK